MTGRDWFEVDAERAAMLPPVRRTPSERGWSVDDLGVLPDDDPDQGWDRTSIHTQMLTERAGARGTVVAMNAGLDGASLAEAMGNTLPRARYDQLLAPFAAAMLMAGCATINRAAMWCAQIGHESVGLKYMSEIWGPTEAQRGYEGRADLGNTMPGDGSRFRGHGPIQITGRANHAAVSRWAYGRGYVPTATYFVDHPDELGGDRYGFLGVVWYWTSARSRLNAYADAGDLVAATKAINGGLNGLADRTRRWDACRALGARLLPAVASQPASEDDEMAAVTLLLPPGRGVQTPVPVPPYQGDQARLYLSTGWTTARIRALYFIRDKGPGLSATDERWGGSGPFDLAQDDRPSWPLDVGCTQVSIEYDAEHPLAAMIVYRPA